jgi:hypothetical protein
MLKIMVGMAAGGVKAAVALANRIRRKQAYDIGGVTCRMVTTWLCMEARLQRIN